MFGKVPLYYINKH